MNHRNVLVGAFVLYCAVHAWTELKKCNDLPWPPHFIAAGIVMAMLYLFGTLVDEGMSSLMAIGLVIAGIVQGWRGDCTHSGDCIGTSQPAQTSALETVPGQQLD